MSGRGARCVAGLVLAAGAWAQPAPAQLALSQPALSQPALSQPATLSLATSEPRAYGYQVGDLVVRRARIAVPAGLALDPESLPRPGRQGPAFELRRLQRDDGRGSIDLMLEYQVFHAPSAARTLELPPVVLRFTGGSAGGRAQDLRIDAWPVTVAPLVPVEVSPRRGLGELQPDAPPPLLDTGATRGRLAACVGVLALALLFLAHVYLGLPWTARRRAPFAMAWRRLRALPQDGGGEQRRAAYACLHEALNRSAGGALYQHGLDAFVAAHGRYAPLRDELAAFFQHSRAEFFGADDSPGDGDGVSSLSWLTTLARRLRDAERGSA